jgi:hypothetical protein
MANILYTAINSKGKQVHGFVEASTAKQAVSNLESRGYARVQLHQETAISQHADELNGLNDSQRSALAKFKLKAMSKVGLLEVWIEVARREKWLLLICIGMFCVCLWSYNLIWASVLVIVALISFGWSFWQFRHVERYRKLMALFALGKWDEFALLSPKLYSLPVTDPLLQFDIDVRLASIKARRGMLNEALNDLAKWPPRLADKRGLFEAHVASVYGAAGDRENRMRLTKLAYEASGGEPARALDCALLEARYGDDKTAQRILKSIDRSLLPSHAGGFVLWVEGVIQLRQNVGAAEKTIASAITKFMGHIHSPAYWITVSHTVADYAFALEKNKNLPEAQKQIAQVWPVLRAHADDTLLAQMKDANLLLKTDDDLPGLFGLTKTH